MAKKQKNIGHQKAVKRREQAELEMSKLGLKLNDDIAIVGFIFNHLSVSHLTFLGLTNINALCRMYVGIDICIFSQQIIQPCIPLFCSAFGMKDLIRWDSSPIVSTSIGTTLSAISSNADKIYHYAFDPEFINSPSKEYADIVPAFCDPRVKVVVRHESHKKLIETEFDIDVCDVIIPDFDVEALVKLVLTETKNGN